MRDQRLPSRMVVSMFGSSGSLPLADEVREGGHAAVQRAIRLHRHVLGQPLRDRRVLLAAHVDVGIDEAGEHVLLARVDRAAGRRQRGVGADGHDALAVDGDAATDHARRRDDPAVPDHEVDGHGWRTQVSRRSSSYRQGLCVE